MLKFKKNTSNYVIPVWSGARRLNDPRYRKDCTFYLKEHIKSLENLRHNLSQVTVAIADNPKEPKQFADFVETIPKTIRKTPVEVIRRRNYGLSYGAISDVFDLYENQFDYYFFVEDDYMFTLNDFDSVMMKKMSRHKTLGYLCGYVGKYSELKYRHASMSIGCISGEAMSRLKASNGVVWPYPNKVITNPNDYKASEVYGQRGFSQGIINLGYQIDDVLDEYSVGYRERNMSIDMLGENKTKIIMPI